jgi:hypothetical protein
MENSKKQIVKNKIIARIIFFIISLTIFSNWIAIEKIIIKIFKNF